MSEIISTKNATYFNIKFKFLNELTRRGFELEIAIKYQNVYGVYGLFISKYITPYIWILPLVAASFLLLTFRRANLIGPTQKYLIFTMTIDVFFTMLTGFKDAVFNLLEWNYGFIEYKACWILLIFFRFLFILHSTSLWVKSLMFIHRVLMFLVPFKLRQWKIKKICVALVIFHSILSVLYGAGLVIVPLKTFPILQEYKPDTPLIKIDACAIDDQNVYFYETFHRSVHWMCLLIHLVYFSALPICINIFCTFFLIYLVRQEINKISFLAPNCNTKIYNNVKYLILIKVHILLGISFILQEMPIYVSFVYATTGRDGLAIDTAQAVILVNMFQSFAIGKPIDVIIYASLSRKVKSELQKLLCCRKT